MPFTLADKSLLVRWATSFIDNSRRAALYQSHILAIGVQSPFLQSINFLNIHAFIPVKSPTNVIIANVDSSSKVTSNSTVVCTRGKDLTSVQNVEEPLFNCQICSSIWEITPRTPKKTKQFQSQNCQICGKGFATDASLSLHIEKKHRELLNPDESAVSLVRQPKPKAFVCVLCSKSYTTESALAIHAVKHKPTSSPESKSSSESPSSSSPRGFGCRICPETFVTNEGLHEHMKIAHQPPDVLRQPPITYSSIPYCPPQPPGVGVPWFDPYQPYHLPPPNMDKLENSRKENRK